MADVALTPNQVEALTGKTGILAEHITAAANVIHDRTGSTVTQHRDNRTIPESDVQMAWAVVAVRVKREAFAAGDEAVTSESQDGYTYAEDGDLARRYRDAPLTGLPFHLLSLDRITSLEMRPGDMLIGWG